MVGDDSPPSVLLRRHQAHRWRDPSPPARRPLHRPPPLVLGEGTHRCGNRPAQVRLYAAQAEQRARPRLGPPPAMMSRKIEEEFDASKKLLRARSGVVTAGRHSSRQHKTVVTTVGHSDISAANSCKSHQQNRAKLAKRCDRESFWPRSVLGRNATARGHPVMPGRVSRRRIQRPGQPGSRVTFFRVFFGTFNRRGRPLVRG